MVWGKKHINHSILLCISVFVVCVLGMNEDVGLM